MPALAKTALTAKIIWLGRVENPEVNIRATAIDQMSVTLDGPTGEAHAGPTRPSCSRVTGLYPRGTLIANVRQLSVVSAEELQMIAAEMGLAAIDPSWLGASMVIEGIPDFSHVPPSSRLQGPDGAVLVIDMNNHPCQFPSKEIEKDRQGYGVKFKPAAKDRRGVTAWIEKAGTFAIGDELTLHIPDQRAWSQLEGVRALLKQQASPKVISN
jgi:hypothetical protein